MSIEKMEKGIRDIKNMSLSHSEKRHILNNVLNTPIVSPYAPKVSVWNMVNAKFAYMTALALIVVTTGGTFAYADEYSLPGDLLYSIKRNVTEPIHEVLAVTAGAKAEWQVRKTVRRLNEAEELAKKTGLTKEERDRFKKDFNDSLSAFKENIKSISTSSKKVDELRSSFEESIKGHSDIIKEFGSQKSDEILEEINQLRQEDSDQNREDQSNRSSDSQREPVRGRLNLRD